MIYVDNPNLESFDTLLNDYFRRNQPMTYSDKDCEEEQCYEGAYRSFGDMLEMCKTYFPDCTDKQVAEWFVNACEEDLICGDYCGGIDKPVFRFINPDDDYEQTFMNYDYYEDDTPETVGVDGWSQKMIYDLAKGIEEEKKEMMKTLNYSSLFPKHEEVFDSCLVLMLKDGTICEYGDELKKYQNKLNYRNKEVVDLDEEAPLNNNKFDILKKEFEDKGNSNLMGAWLLAKF